MSLHDVQAPSEFLVERIKNYCREMAGLSVDDVSAFDEKLRVALADTITHLFTFLLDYELPGRTISILLRNIDRIRAESKGQGGNYLAHLLEELRAYAEGRKTRRKSPFMIQANRLLLFLRLLDQMGATIRDRGKYFPQHAVDALMVRFGIGANNEIASVFWHGLGNWQKSLPRHGIKMVSAIRIVRWYNASEEDDSSLPDANGFPGVVLLFYAIRVGAVTEADLTK